MLTRALYNRCRYRYRYPPVEKNPHLVFLHHSHIGLTLSQLVESIFWSRKILNPPSYRYASISRHHCMYTKVLVQNSSVSPEAFSLFDSSKSLVLTGITPFLSQKSIIIICFKLPEKRTPLWHIYSVKLILTPSLTQLTPVRDGDRPLCLVTFHMDKYKHRTCIHPTSHTDYLKHMEHKNILSFLYQNKI